ncbi:hypothetical protein H2204_014681 [Knufia peltigerae]|uniref:Uncharacterized protein n=1 Tax=Knufia peltigerae TaxID=1002370 RepID=A0AA38XHY5_9EURO|nr:hypothetical protein H2204_014681 [Knufia peltigerae]
MPPRQVGPPKTFTWITGDPRSKQNVSQIRRHVKTTSDVRTGHLGRIHPARPSPPPSPSQSATTAQTQPFETDFQHWAGTHATSTPAEAGTPQTHNPSPEAASTPQRTCSSPTRRLTIDELVNAADDQDDDSVDRRSRAAASQPDSENISLWTQQQNQGALHEATPDHLLTKDNLDNIQHPSNQH